MTGSGTSNLTVHGNVVVLPDAVLGMGCEPIYSPCSDDRDAITGGTLTSKDYVFGSLDEYQPLGIIVHAVTLTGSVSEQGRAGHELHSPTAGIFSTLQFPTYSDYEDNAIGGNLDV